MEITGKVIKVLGVPSNLDNCRVMGTYYEIVKCL